MASRPRIRVINPNSNEAVTRGIDDAIAPLRFADGPEIVCSTLAEGPFGVETQEHVESVALPLRRLVESDNASDAAGDRLLQRSRPACLPRGHGATGVRHRGVRRALPRSPAPSASA